MGMSTTLPVDLPKLFIPIYRHYFLLFLHARRWNEKALQKTPREKNKN